MDLRSRNQRLLFEWFEARHYVTLVAPIGRLTVAEKVTIFAHADHHVAAECKKRAKPGSRSQFDIKITRRWRARSTPLFVLLSL